MVGCAQTHAHRTSHRQEPSEEGGCLAFRTIPQPPPPTVSGWRPACGKSSNAVEQRARDITNANENKPHPSLHSFSEHCV